eukprot:366273-Chlamydomonas_euryale.AAC.6
MQHPFLTPIPPSIPPASHSSLPPLPPSSVHPSLDNSCVRCSAHQPIRPPIHLLANPCIPQSIRAQVAAAAASLPGAPWPHLRQHLERPCAQRADPRVRRRQRAAHAARDGRCEAGDVRGPHAWQRVRSRFQQRGPEATLDIHTHAAKPGREVDELGRGEGWQAAGGGGLQAATPCGGGRVGNVAECARKERNLTRTHACAQGTTAAAAQASAATSSGLKRRHVCPGDAAVVAAAAHGGVALSCVRSDVLPVSPLVRDRGREARREEGQGHRDKGTKGHRDKGTQGHRDTGTKGHRHTGTQGQRDTGTKGRPCPPRCTLQRRPALSRPRGQRTRGHAHLLYPQTFRRPTPLNAAPCSAAPPVASTRLRSHPAVGRTPRRTSADSIAGARPVVLSSSSRPWSSAMKLPNQPCDGRTPAPANACDKAMPKAGGGVGWIERRGSSSSQPWSPAIKLPNQPCDCCTPAHAKACDKAKVVRGWVGRGGRAGTHGWCWCCCCVRVVALWGWRHLRGRGNAAEGGSAHAPGKGIALWQHECIGMVCREGGGEAGFLPYSPPPRPQHTI